MSHQKKKKSAVKYGPMVVLMLISVICGFFLGQLFAQAIDPDWSTGRTLLTFLGLMLFLSFGIIFQLTVHEAGHLIFGLLSGYRFSSFRIFSFMLVKGPDGMKIRRLSIAGTGGQCLMVPPDMVNGKFPVTLFNLGGSIMNLLVGFIFLILYFLLGSYPICSVLMLCISGFGIFFALTNGIPMRLGGVDNDGYNAFALTKHPDALRSFWVQLKTNEQIANGVRLKDMPEEWFTVPSDEAMKNSMVAALGVFACNRLMDEGKFEEADRLMEHMLQIDSGMVGIHRNLLICDRMYIELITQNRVEKMAEMLTKEQEAFMKTMKTFPSVLRTQYALALLSKKDMTEALRIQTQFNKTAKKYPHPNEIQAEQELMDIARATAQAHTSAG